MILEFEIRNFKSIASGILPLSALTLLIGPNASGKSNVIEAMRLLCWLAHGRRLGELVAAIKDSEIDVRGGPPDLTRDHQLPLTLGCTLGSEVGSSRVRLVLDLTFTASGIRISGESLESPSISELPLYRIEQQAGPYGTEVQVAYNNFLRGGRKPLIPCIDQQAIFTQLTTPARFEAKHERSQEVIPGAAASLQHGLESVLFLDPVPRRMRQYSFVIEKELRGDGSSLSSVLYDLCVVQGRKDEVLSFVRSLPEQDIVDIDFLRGPRDEVMVKLHESFGGRTRAFEAALLSDGTMRVLAVAAALLSVVKGSLVVIEEIDNGVHPSRARALLENLQQTAQRRDLRVLLTTHNPALMDAIPVSAIPNVVFCHRDPVEGDTRLTRLVDHPDYSELVAQGPLGVLSTRGIIEDRLKRPASAEDRRRRADEVMRLLRSEPRAS